jgi:hypothetical protein
MPSSVVAEIMYDKRSQTLRVVSILGMIYDYKDVPEKIYTAMKMPFRKDFSQ